MKRINFGNTLWKVSPIGLGMAALGRPGYINLGHAEDLKEDYSLEAMQNHSWTMLNEAQKLGINYFDAARSYGKAEYFLGNWLQKHPQDAQNLIIGSKWGYTYTANWQIQAQTHEVKEHSLAVFQKQVQETRENLGNHLNLYQIHSATLESGVLENVEVLNALAKLKQENVCLGLSLSGTNQAEVLRKALSIELDGQELFSSVQATWNVLERSAGPALKEAHRAGWGIIIKEALANGRLSSRNQDPSFASQMQILSSLAQKHQCGIDALALAEVLRQPFVHLVLSGAAQIAHLHANVKALEVDIDEASTQQLASLQETPATYWQTRKNLQWN